MELHQSYFNQSKPHARNGTRRPLTTQTQHNYRRICGNIIVVVLTLSGLISTQVAQALSLPRNIVSRIHYNKIDSSTTELLAPDFADIRAFNINPAPLVTNQDLTGHNELVGTSYADAQSQWGNSASARFVSDSGISATSFYIANFTKDNDEDVLTTRISNTHLELRDFGSQDPGDLVAGFSFIVSLLPGAIDGRSGMDLDPATNPSLITAFNKQVGILGRRGATTDALNDPFSGPFQLFGDHDIFTGNYTESGSGSVSGVNFFSGANYDLDTVEFEFGLDEFNSGEDFTVVWQATSQALTQGGETSADVEFWDPIGGTPGPFFTVGPSTSPVPLPAAVWLFGTGLLGLLGVGSRKRKLNQD